jgi:predicted DNA-binding transcriptional regulator YafY
MGRKWNRDASPGEKLLGLYCTLLFSRREMSLSELAESLECSKQTIGRLINNLEATCYGQIDRRPRGREAYYFLRLAKNLPQVALDAEGLAQLALCRDFMVHLLPEDMRRKMRQTLDLTTAYLPAEDREAPPKIGQGLAKGAIDYTPHQGKLQTLREAIKAGRLCAVSYRKDRTQPAKSYDFAPKKLLAFQGSLRVTGWIVDGRTPARAKYDDPAVLSVQRLTQVRLLEKSGLHLPEPPVNEDVFGFMADEIFTARVRFQEGAADYVEERTWSADQHFEPSPDGSLILTFQAQSSLEVISWVLGFGAKAEILEPDWLRAEMAEAVQALAKVYPA